MPLVCRTSSGSPKISRSRLSAMLHGRLRLVQADGRA
jgi:hypothetical protein